MQRKELRKASLELLSVLAENVRAYRDAKNLSQEDLAGLCNLHRTYIGSIERCERNVTLSTLETLANAFGVTVQDLLSRKQQ